MSASNDEVVLVNDELVETNTITQESTKPPSPGVAECLEASTTPANKIDAECIETEKFENNSKEVIIITTPEKVKDVETSADTTELDGTSTSTHNEMETIDKSKQEDNVASPAVVPENTNSSGHNLMTELNKEISASETAAVSTSHTEAPSLTEATNSNEDSIKSPPAHLETVEAESTQKIIENVPNAENSSNENSNDKIIIDEEKTAVIPEAVSNKSTHAEEEVFMDLNEDACVSTTSQSEVPTATNESLTETNESDISNIDSTVADHSIPATDIVDPPVSIVLSEESIETKDAEIDESASITIKEDKLEQPKCRDILNAVELMENIKINLRKSPTMEENECLIYTDKECINYNCPKTKQEFVNARCFVLNYYKVIVKKYKSQYVCTECYENALTVYQKSCGILAAKQPLVNEENTTQHVECVAIDSSDEEDSSENSENTPARSDFSKNDLKLIESELMNSMEKVFSRIDIQKQMTWIQSVVTARSNKIQQEIDLAEKELREVQNLSDRVHNSFYGRPRFTIKSLPPLDINCTYNPPDMPGLPPVGDIEFPPVQINGSYYAAKNKVIASWVPCRVVEQIESTTIGNMVLKNYRIKYQSSHNQTVRTVSAKNLAYSEPPSVRLIIGTRVIAYFDATTLARGKERILVQSAFYPGIIAEPMKPANKFRYLIFYDDGYTQYVHHKDVRLVCQASDKVWEDIHPGSREFIKNYIEQYSVNRPMVQTQKGQSMNTETNGTWHYARVIDTDCSLILMQFDGPKTHTEWIYRGSLRLGPVFKEYQKTMQKHAESQSQSRLPRRTEPFIRYTEDMEASNRQVNQQQQQRAIAKKSVSRQDSNTAQTHQAAITSAAAAAASIASASSSSSSTSSAANTVRHLNNSTIYVDDENRPKGQVIFYTAKRNLPPRHYKPHICHSGCLFKMLHALDAYSPLAKPLLSGWERMKFKQKIKKSIVYRAPCGKSLRNIQEVHRYLRETNNVLNVENFDFCPDLHCLAEYVIDSAIVQMRDISGGQEKIALPLVNYYDSTLPPPCQYAAQRIPTEGVPLNLDPDFLVGCDCEDDCSDKSKCSCWKLTIEGARYMNPNKPIEEIGYQYKRLLEHVPTGIYECNKRCKCQSNCLNRVVQHSLEMKLQVFKTSNRGWGLRCINDIPQGAFICIYAGHLLTEAKANEGGADAGDEYFADLDYIEVAEQLKEGYESDVDHSEHEDSYQPDRDDDDDFRPSKSTSQRMKNNKQRNSRLGSNSLVSDEDSQERQVISFNPNAEMDENVRENSVRRLFGKNETPYIMDAKTIGNLGRYFNHSCNPNLFVQNVFVDTHDLRFPWVAFFAVSNIRSGSELTWNYNYEVGVVPGKVLYCQCGAQNCRIRLL